MLSEFVFSSENNCNITDSSNIIAEVEDNKRLISSNLTKLAIKRLASNSIECKDYIINPPNVFEYILDVWVISFFVREITQV
jgi:hypothetical protein